MYAFIYYVNTREHIAEALNWVTWQRRTTFYLQLDTILPGISDTSEVTWLIASRIYFI